MLDTLNIALARQPIFDRANQLVGYELLYRRSSSDVEAIPQAGGSAQQMSSDAIASAFLGIGVHRVTGGKRSFVNVDRAMLLEGSITVLDPREVVVELLESVGVGPEVLAACQALVKQGYTLALDDFVYAPEYEPLLRLAAIVKLDVLGKSVEELRDAVDRLRPFGVCCLAERVETAEMRSACAQLGFELFQGYFFARPETLSGRDISIEHGTIIRLLNLLRDPSKSDAEVEAVFKGDLGLTHKLLSIVNCASMGHSGLTSIGHAMRLLGRTAMHRWMALLLVSSLATKTGGTRDELVEMAMVRARFCEMLMNGSGKRRDAGASFVTGLFSLLDVLLQVSMSKLVARLHLTPELEQALLVREGPYAPALRVAEAYEGARWLEVFSAADAVGVAVDDVPELYVQALEWARHCRAGTAAA